MRFRSYLLPGSAEQDEGFRQEILRVGHLGLQVVGILEIAIALFGLFAGWVWSGAALAALGGLTLWSSTSQRGYEWSRLLGCLSLIGGALVIIRFDTPELAALLMMGAVAALPLYPLQTLALGVAMTIADATSAGVSAPGFLFFAALTVLATVLTAVVYRQRLLAYQAYIQMVHACEDLRSSQARTLVSENAVSMARLAAALSHELNSPMGALQSAVSTLVSLTARLADPAGDRERLIRLQGELCRSVEDAARRMQQTVARMQRFTNLDKSDVQPANLNELLEDVAALLEPQIQGGSKLRFDFQPLPLMLVRKQQISAVFSALLNNAADAVNGEGSVVISTRMQQSYVEVKIHDDGRGMARETARAVFDPGYKVVDGRVLTGNWQMFHSRQVIREHGGDIGVQTEEGQGTTVTVTLPVGIRAAAAG
jgi:signal transduction histidine kinase